MSQANWPVTLDGMASTGPDMTEKRNWWQESLTLGAMIANKGAFLESPGSSIDFDAIASELDSFLSLSAREDILPDAVCSAFVSPDAAIFDPIPPP